MLSAITPESLSVMAWNAHHQLTCRKRGDTIARINFVELPAKNLPAAKEFYESVFGWTLTDFGPSYSCTMTGNVDLGLQGDLHEAPRAPLPVVMVDNLEAAQAAVERAGGKIVKPIFSFLAVGAFSSPIPTGWSWR